MPWDGTAQRQDYPVVLRFDQMSPDMLARYEAHRARRAEEYEQVDKAKSRLNRRLIGQDGWEIAALLEINSMRMSNYADELEALKKRKRPKDLNRRMLEGPHDPWRPSKDGPMRELILTAHHNWFDGDVETFLGADSNERIEEFQACAVSFLRYHFGADVIEAHADLDEHTFHIHAVIMPRATVTMTRKGKVIATRRMLQPSIHPLIEDYEKAQDAAGFWFSSVGLVREERRKQAWRDALALDKTPPPKAYHKKTRVWREEQDIQRARKAKALKKSEAELDDARHALSVEASEVAKTKAESEAILAVADAVATGAFSVEDPNDMTLSQYAVADRDDAVGGEDVPQGIRRLNATAKASPEGARRTIGLFAKAFARMRKDAEMTERKRLERLFADSFSALREAAAVISDVESSLPSAARSAVKTLRGRVEGALSWSMKAFARDTTGESLGKGPKRPREDGAQGTDTQ